MGARGPVKIPSHLQAVPSDSAAEEESTAAEKVSLAAPEKPEGLPEQVSVAWDAIVPTLAEAGMVSPADGPTVELAVRHYVQSRMASDELLSSGSVVVRDEKNDRDAKHPSSQVMRDHSEQFLKYATQLGLAFVARARVDVSKRSEDRSSSPFSQSG